MMLMGEGIRRLEILTDVILGSRLASCCLVRVGIANKFQCKGESWDDYVFRISSQL